MSIKEDNEDLLKHFKIDKEDNEDLLMYLENNKEYVEPALDNRKVNREIKDLQQRAHIYKTRLIAIEEEERALSDKKIYLTECLYSCQQRYKELSRKLNK